jgi:hypothetical protein
MPGANSGRDPRQVHLERCVVQVTVDGQHRDSGIFVVPVRCRPVPTWSAASPRWASSGRGRACPWARRTTGFGPRVGPKSSLCPDGTA